LVADWKTGDNGGRAVRVEDVAREAGVSPITVSRTLSNPEKVREETRRRVEAAVAKTGYVLNRFASSLRSGHSTIVAVFVSNLSNPHFANAIQGCSAALEGSHYHLLMAQTGYSDKLQQDVLEEVLPFRPAAIMFTGIVQSEAVRSRLKLMDVPVMEMWDYRPDPIDMLIGFSNAEGGQLLGRHFRERGFKSIAYAGRTEDRGAQRLGGFAEGLGRPPEMVLPLEGKRSINDGMAALETILEEMPGCDAIVFGTDLLAVGAVLKARKMGVSIPGQLAVAGYGDLDVARQLSPSLTSVHVSGHEMGLAAGQMLLRRLKGETIDEPIVLSPIHLEVRDSSS
jgi:LacI family gluconate utilization system Gnt-I transcriptional repressor